MFQSAPECIRSPHTDGLDLQYAPCEAPEQLEIGKERFANQEKQSIRNHIGSMSGLKVLKQFEVHVLLHCSALSVDAMPFQKQSRQKVKPMVGSDKTTILRVEPYNLCGKHMLRPYAKDGSAVFVPKGVSLEKKLLTTAKMLDRATSQHWERCRRPHYGLSFAGASVQELREFAQGIAAEISSTMENTMGLFSDDTHKPLFRALEFLNQDNEIDRDEKTATGHVDNLFKVLVENSDKFEKKLRKAIMVSSRMYSGSVALFELMALVNDPKKWAKKIQPQKQQSKAVRAWLEDPRNEHKAKKALAKLVCDGTGKEKKKKQEDSQPGQRWRRLQRRQLLWPAQEETEESLCLELKLRQRCKEEEVEEAPAQEEAEEVGGFGFKLGRKQQQEEVQQRQEGQGRKEGEETCGLIREQRGAQGDEG